jgi:hypothetical protein
MSVLEEELAVTVLDGSAYGCADRAATKMITADFAQRRASVIQTGSLRWRASPIASVSQRAIVPSCGAFTHSGWPLLAQGEGRCPILVVHASLVHVAGGEPIEALGALDSSVSQQLLESL